MEPLDLNELARLRVKPRNLNEYDNALKVFVDWLPDGTKKGTAEEMDVLLNTFAHWVYRERKVQGLSLAT